MMMTAMMVAATRVTTMMTMIMKMTKAAMINCK
jgi:hypothetical protein